MARKRKSRKRKTPAVPPVEVDAARMYPPGAFVPPAGGVSVRMYRQGFGDCFLIAISVGGGAGVYYMVIDCGVIKNPPGDPDFLSKVVRNIREDTGGRIDALLVTHEHWDHVSGFKKARDEWDLFGPEGIREVWVAWTEDGRDPLAAELGQDRRSALALVNQAMARFVNPAGPMQSRVKGLAAFFGADEPGKSVGRTREAMDYAMARAKRGGKDGVRYLMPHGEPVKVDLVDSVRFYVLGPPHDKKKIKRSDPSASGKEVYSLARVGDSLRVAMKAQELAASGQDPWKAMSSDERDRYAATFPFDADVRRSWEQAMGDPFFAELYGPKDAGPGHAQAWRRIDDDWIGGAAGRLALSLDSDTNNTSLVLAIEVVKTGKVLLFVGDAQVGNWLSWHDAGWTLDGRADAVSAKDLLGRTVLYKVGHHGSHNATLSEMGLEMMTDPGLVAMIPTSKQMARDKRWNEIPFEPLLTALDTHARGRVLRADLDYPKPGQKRPAAAKDTEWAAFLASTKVTPLYIQHDVPGN